jgi:hypothetical protein
MEQNPTYIYDNRREDILKDFPHASVCAFLKKSEKVLTHYMPPHHCNAQYTKEDFARQLVTIACHGDFISNGSCVYTLEHAGSSGDTLLYHLHNLTLEDIQKLYDTANRRLLHLAKKQRIYKRFNVQIALDFVGSLFYGDHRDD